jgi:hypothetical protein
MALTRQKTLAVLAAILLFVPIPAIAGPPDTKTRRASDTIMFADEEWNATGYFLGVQQYQFYDTNGDGAKEMVLCGNAKDAKGSWYSRLMIWDLVNSMFLWDKKLSTFDGGIKAGDFNNDTVPEIRYAAGHKYYTMTAKDYIPLGNSSGLGNLTNYPMEFHDVDADGKEEFIIINATTNASFPNEANESWVEVYDSVSFRLKATGPKMGPLTRELFTWFTFENLDDDPQDEIIVMGGRSTGLYCGACLIALDGQTCEEQFRVPEEANVTDMRTRYIGNLDADPDIEILATTYDRYFQHPKEIIIYSAKDGSAEWRVETGNLSYMPMIKDVNNDGQLELGISYRTGMYTENSSYTHKLFDLSNHTELWSAGPINYNKSYSQFWSLLDILDLDGDAVMEIVVNTYSLLDNVEQNTVEVINGGDFSRKWLSPTYNSTVKQFQPFDMDGDGSGEIVLTEAWIDGGYYSGRVHVLCAGNFTERWVSEALPGIATVSVADDFVAGNATVLLKLENVTSLSQYRSRQLVVCDGGMAELWSSPKFYNLNYLLGDFSVAPGLEMLLAGINGTDQSGNSSWSVLGDGGRNVFYQSGMFMSCFMTIRDAGDLDNDGRIEFFPTRTDGAVSIFELTEVERPRPDLVIGPEDVALSNSTPMAGNRLDIDVRVRNEGALLAANASVEFLVDGASQNEGFFDIPSKGFAPVRFSWLAKAGDHSFEIRADGQDLIEEGNETNNTVRFNLSVMARPPPVAGIGSPLEGDRFVEGANISFDGGLSSCPPGGILQFVWRYSEGVLNTSPSFHRVFPVGDHTVSLTVSDGFGYATASVNFTVAPKPPPGTTVAVISSPKNRSVFTAGEQITFDSAGSLPARPEYSLTFSWTSNVTGMLGTGAVFSCILVPGIHEIRLEVDDGHGGNSTDSVSITVKAPVSLVAVISHPVEGRTFFSDQEVIFDASNSSGPDGAVLSFNWSSNLSGPLGTGRMLQRILPEGAHRITMTMQDEKGHSASAVVNISVVRRWVEPPVKPPSVKFTSPGENALVKGVVLINGTAWSARQVLKVQVRIDNGSWMDAAGTANWSFSWDTAQLPNGTHRITARASDGDLFSPEASINVTVDNRAYTPSPNPGARWDGLRIAVLAILVAVVALGVGGFIVYRRRISQRKG